MCFCLFLIYYKKNLTPELNYEGAKLLPCWDTRIACKTGRIPVTPPTHDFRYLQLFLIFTAIFKPFSFIYRHTSYTFLTYGVLILRKNQIEISLEGIRNTSISTRLAYRRNHVTSNQVHWKPFSCGRLLCAPGPLQNLHVQSGFCCFTTLASIRGWIHLLVSDFFRFNTQWRI